MNGVVNVIAICFLSALTAAILIAVIVSEINQNKRDTWWDENADSVMIDPTAPPEVREFAEEWIANRQRKIKREAKYQLKQDYYKAKRDS